MKNELKNLDKFRKILSSYKLSPELINDLNKIKLILISAPTSVGRNTVIRELVNSGEYYFIVSDTTRHPRFNDGVMEKNGGPYWFKSEEEVLSGLEQGNYFGPAIIHNQQVSGMHVDEIIKASKLNKVPVTEMEVQGVADLTKIKHDIITIFMLPPSFEEWMNRLKHRGKMSSEEFKRRLTSAVDEFDFALKSNMFIYLINEDYHQTASLIQALVANEKADLDYQNKCIKLLISLKQEVKSLLSTLD